jgi:hypothetical protein
MRRLIIIILILLPVNAFSQVSGIVMDKIYGYPVRNVNIRVEGQNIGTTSDHEGNFSIPGDIIGNTLIVSAIGFETQRVVVDKKVLKIDLIIKVYQLNEVVITSEKKRGSNNKMEGK